MQKECSFQGSVFNMSLTFKMKMFLGVIVS